MYYPTDAQTLAQVRAHEWDRELTAMHLADAAGTPMNMSASGNQLGRLLVDVFVALRGSLSRRTETRTA